MMDRCYRACSGCRTQENTCYNVQTDADCEEWAADGQCDINPEWMYPNCRKTCLRCDRGTGQYVGHCSPPPPSFIQIIHPSFVAVIIPSCILSVQLFFLILPVFSWPQLAVSPVFRLIGLSIACLQTVNCPYCLF